MTESTPREFTLSWALDAPAAQVFRAWTDPEHLQWYYNDHQPIPDEPIEVDLRVGGVWRQRMVISEATDFVTGGVYREIVRDEKLVFNWGATGGWPELDLERPEESPLVTVSMKEVAGRTEMSVRVQLPEGISEAQAQEWLSRGIREGWRDTVDRLATELAPAPAAS